MKPPVDRLMLGQARAEVAALRAEVEHLRGEHLHPCGAKESELIALRAENGRLQSSVAAYESAEQRMSGELSDTLEALAAANALLDEAKHVLVDWNNYQATEGLSHIPEDETAACLDKLDAHLAGQPAAPTRTAAEQRVLDACRNTEFTPDGYITEESDETAIGLAELARRAATKGAK